MEIITIILIIAVWIALHQKIKNLQEVIQNLRLDINKMRKSTTDNLQQQNVQQERPALQQEIKIQQEEVKAAPAPEKTPAYRQEETVTKVAPTPTLRAESAPAAPRPSVKAPRKAINYEKYIGENLFGKIGILILVIGMGFFVKYAIDNEWINETLRTILGFAVGGGLLETARRLQKKYRTFSSLLAGGAFAIFYVTVAIAYHYYGLFSQTAAFIILVVLTILMSVLAILYDRRELAVTALAGGFVAPFLVSSGAGNYVVLFTYMTILNVGMFGLSVYKKWAELPVISFAFSWLIMAVYVIVTLLTESTALHLFLFATFFYLMFLLPVIFILQNSSTKITRLLLTVVTLNNFIYLAFGLSYLNLISGEQKTSGLLALFVALVNLTIILWLKKRKVDCQLLLYTLLGVVITFVSLSIPLQLEGNYITLFWASESLLLLWLFTRSEIRIYEYFSGVMLLCTLSSYGMDILNAADITGTTIFLNGQFATSLFVALTMLAYAFILEKHKNLFLTTHVITWYPFNAITLLAACTIGYYAFMCEFGRHIPDSATARTVGYTFTAGAILLTSYLLRKRFPFNKHLYVYLAAAGLNAILFPAAYLTASGSWNSSTPALLCWLFLALIVLNVLFVARQYYIHHNYQNKETTGFLIFINLLSVILLVTATANLLNQAGVDEFSAGFSISLAIAGFVQMAWGMKLHLKALRIISLVTFGIVLGKLILTDLWLLPTIGKIIVFIILGIILLTLSFLYQKLKDILFKNEENKTE